MFNREKLAIEFCRVYNVSEEIEDIVLTSFMSGYNFGKNKTESIMEDQRTMLFKDAISAGISVEFIHLVNTYLDNGIVNFDGALNMLRNKLKELTN